MRFSLFTILAFLALCHAASYNGHVDFWCFDLDKVRYPDWMSGIDDNIILSKLAIPGTHNSMTDRIKNSMMQTQNVQLGKQLSAGIRYVDVSCKIVDGNLMVYHGKMFTGYSLGNAFHTIFSFLDRHPREAVILRIKNDSPNETPEAFIELFHRYLDPETELGSRAIQHIYSKYGGVTTIPTLGEVRGKVFILQDFESDTYGQFGLPWNSPSVSSKYFRFGADQNFLPAKWTIIQTYIMSLALKSSQKLRITALTFTLASKPIGEAYRKRIEGGINKRLGKFLFNARKSSLGCLLGGRKARVGIIAMDYPGKYLVGHVLKLNDVYRDSGSLKLPSDGSVTVAYSGSTTSRVSGSTTSKFDSSSPANFDGSSTSKFDGCAIANADESAAANSGDPTAINFDDSSVSNVDNSGEVSDDNFASVNGDDSSAVSDDDFASLNGDSFPVADDDDNSAANADGSAIANPDDSTRTKTDGLDSAAVS
ncbi:hypothetical protein Cpir12675_005553 [Ceratocystis pirilliformis]|uniref:Phosphatidylinositol-specific phospholipase C X domain-containing protein n=1 Tax=Ceratocystis pirilliformis TaxID=259994 RepID=A0ABR3YPK8_9PEZI